MKVRFQNLQDTLRAAIWARLERGDMTGTVLAAHAGFQQAHLSNFLNGRRGLSLQAMDRLLDVLRLDVLDLAGVNETARLRDGSGSARPNMQRLAVVRLLAAASFPRFDEDQIQDTIEVSKLWLRRLKPKMVGNRRDWTRFVVVKVVEEEVSGMAPLVSAGALLLLDRYCNWPPPPSEIPDTSLYAVRDGQRCLVRRITAAHGSLLLRPLREGENSPVALIPVPPGRRHGDFVVGRVRHLWMEL
jgi:transcriptional regulator with XRE-family HTH domain